MSSINNMISSATDSVETSYNTYVSAWKEAPVKMALGHLSVGAAVAGAIYYREDINQLGQKAFGQLKLGKDFVSSKWVTFTRNSFETLTACKESVKNTGLKTIQATGKFARESFNTIQSKVFERGFNAYEYGKSSLNSVKTAAYDKASTLKTDLTQAPRIIAHFVSTTAKDATNAAIGMIKSK